MGWVRTKTGYDYMANGQRAGFVVPAGRGVWQGRAMNPKTLAMSRTVKSMDLGKVMNSVERMAQNLK